MADSVDVVLQFLRKNRFSNAEAALRAELNARPDLNGFLQKHLEEEKAALAGSAGTACSMSPPNGDLVSEFVVKEVEVGGVGNASKSKKNSSYNQGQESHPADLYPWHTSSTSSTSNSVRNERSIPEVVNNFSDLLSYKEPKHRPVSSVLEKKDCAVSTEPDLLVEQIRVPYGRGKIKAEVEMVPEIDLIVDHEDNNAFPEEHFLDKLWSKREDPSTGCSVKTVIPFPAYNTSSSCEGRADHRKESKKKAESNGIKEAVKEQADVMSRSHFSLKSQEYPKTKESKIFDPPFIGENHREELPRLPPVRLKSEDKLVNIHWDEKAGHHASEIRLSNADNTFLIGSFLDVPVGQEINSSGDESIDYPNEYWDSDEYDDDDDVGYMRQPIEDETWFLAHEIDYPSDNEKNVHGSIPPQQDHPPRKDDDDDQSFAEEESYLSGEQYLQAKHIEKVSPSVGPIGHKMLYRRIGENDLLAHYDGQLMDAEELNLMRAEPVWQGFVSQNSELVMLGNGKMLEESEQPQADDPFMEDDQHGSVRSVGVGINSDAADFGSEVRESLVGGSSEGEYFPDYDIGMSGRRHSQSNIAETNKNKSKRGNMDGKKPSGVSFLEGGFSFPPPLRAADMLKAGSCKPLWSNKGCNVIGNSDKCGDDTENMIATWKRKSSEFSPIQSSRDEQTSDDVRSRKSSTSSASNYDPAGTEGANRGLDYITNETREEYSGTTLEDEEIAALQEQVSQIKAQEEEFETFDLKIVHRKNRTGFEEEKNFHVVLNSVIAGRYHVTEYLGSAAFSKAIQAHDLHTGMDVCVKIIKNNKDFFDQSLDEIKLLKFVNKHDPSDKFHILRLYDYFYYREHLLIVCELLKANLYEFHKFNRESGGEVYFTMPRLQSITIQCLEALQFLHGLGLIHCDLKPENILIKSYSRCEVKVIDLGSSCFETDHLCSYVQSRSYRAPEVILGLPYDKRIDIWSLGCILAELCSGNVLFQNDSPATLLARVMGITGPIDQEMLAKGRDTYKYFTKSHMLYERNQETNRLEYLIPKKTSLRYRLPMGDPDFVEFVAHLLEVNPKKRPSASEALKHPWLSYPYEPISS
ncbi:hypothetical protein Cni_G18131 [Canna indica]|uniref:Protein kinase domain-containing protein n=1 Tax=Canna indica TaxID=4628 RepID=A0AAQ3KIA3_9LILI|nr:hypothetical protein Cni_G18131 [Canna indica]